MFPAMENPATPDLEESSTSLLNCEIEKKIKEQDYG